MSSPTVPDESTNIDWLILAGLYTAFGIYAVLRIAVTG